MNIITEYPFWFIIFCPAIAFAYSFLFYRNDKTFREVSVWWLRAMMGFRFAVVLVLVFFILSPFIRSFTNYIEKPLILVAQDNSESVLMCKDSIVYKTTYKNDFNKLIEKLSADYEVKSFSFGEKTVSDVNFLFNNKQTDISELFSELKNKYINRNVGALVLASDGIYNKGSNPAYATSDMNYPVYTVTLGDTSAQKDVILSKVNYNKIAFLGNKFPIQINIDIKELNGAVTQLNIYNNGQKIFTKPINSISRSYTELVNLETEAFKTGVQHYKIELVPVKDEVNVLNNYRDIVVDVIDSKQKILILANAPHPDIGAMIRALESNQNLQVDFFTADKFSGFFINYNLVILHQLPSKTNAFSKELSEIIAKNIPVLYILGGQSSLDNINNLHTGFEIRQSKNAFDESQSFFNKQFSLFQMSDDMQEFISKAPPLVTPFGEYRYSDNQNILLFQKVSGVATSRPLIIFSTSADVKSGFIAGEGLWRWRMMNYLQHSNYDIFDELLNKITQFLALKVNKDNFIVNTKKIVDENEAFVFDAEVYNESFELNNTSDVTLDIVNNKNKKFSFIFEKSNNAYHLNSGIFPVGDYLWTAKTKSGKKDLVKNGKITVISLNVEGERTIADHKILYSISKNTSGKTFMPLQMEQLYQSIKANHDIVSVSYSEKQLMELISLKWIFFLLIILLSAEWFFRKYFGNY